MTLSPLSEGLLRPLLDGRAKRMLDDGELLHLAERAQQHAGDEVLATELLAVAKRLHDAGAVEARDQAVIVAAVVLEDMELNGALCRRLYAGRKSMGSVVGHPSVERPDPHAVTDPRKSVLRTRLASLAGVKSDD